MRYRHNSQLSGNIFDFQSLEGALAYLFTRGTYFYNFLLKVTLSSKTGTLKTKPKYECVGESVGGGEGRVLACIIWLSTPFYVQKWSCLKQQ